MSNSTDQADAFRCYLFNNATPDAWGDCCDDLSIVPKPVYVDDYGRIRWVVFLLSVPIEAVLAGADVRATAGMYEEKSNQTAVIFLLYNFVTLGLLAYQFDWGSCEASVEGVWECYQGLLFMFYNSTAALASMTLWMLIIMRKYYPQLYFVTRLVISPRFLWRWFDRLNLKNGGTHATVERWHMISTSTKLFWYNKVGIVTTLLFGGITHIIPMFFAYPYILVSMCIALVYSHSLRLGYTGLKDTTNLWSTIWNVLVFYPLSLVVSTLFLCLSPLSLLLKLCGVHSMDRKDESLPMVNPEDTGEMEIFFKTEGGGLITLEFHKEESVVAVLPKVQDNLGFDFIKRTIHLKFNGEQLEESETVTLAEYGIKSGDVLEIIVDPEKIEIFVRLENGDILAIKINAQATVSALMEELAKQSGIASQEQYLLLGGEQLDPASILAGLGLQPENELELYPLRITLSITLSNRGTVRATVDRTLSYSELLETIAPFEDTTAEFVRLTLDGAELSHNESLHTQGLTNDTELVSMKEVEVVVRMEEGEPITVRISVQATVKELMEELAENSGLPVDSQYLVCGGEQIDRDSVLDEFEKHEFQLFNVQIEVTVELSNGDSAQVICQRGDNYSTLRASVARLEGTSPDLVHLYHDSSELENNRTLHVQGIRSNAVLLCQRMIKVAIEWEVESEMSSLFVEMDSHSTVKDLKTHLRTRYGMSSETQVVMFANLVADNEVKLNEIDATELTFYVLPLMLTLTVERAGMSDEEKFEIDIERTATFDELKAKIAEMLGIDVDKVNLAFPRLSKGAGYEEIEGTTTLHELGVQEGEVVILQEGEDESDQLEAEVEDIEEQTTEKRERARAGGGGLLRSVTSSLSQGQKKRIAPSALSAPKSAKLKDKKGGKPAKPPKVTKEKRPVPKPLFREEKSPQVGRSELLSVRSDGKRQRRQPPGTPPEQEVVVAPRITDAVTSLRQQLDEGGGFPEEGRLELEELPAAKRQTLLAEEDGEVITVEDKRAERAERRRERRRRVLAYIKDILRNLCMFDPNGKIIMFAAATTFLCFTFSANYALILYSGAAYLDVIVLDWNARSSLLWFQCTATNFIDINAFGLIDFLGLAIGTAAALIEFVDFLVSI